MTYQEVLENARKTIKNCNACPECNGLACGSKMPGPGSKAGGAHENWKAWRNIRLNIDTFAPNTDVDTTFRLFGQEFSMPLFTGPIGTLLQYSDTDVTVEFNDGVMQAAKEHGIINCFGDGLAPQTVPGALASIEKYGVASVPVLNPMPNEKIIRTMEEVEKSSAFAVAVVVDSAGLGIWNKLGSGGMGSKTIEDLKLLKSHTKKPFIVKGIMNARAAERALEAGADAIMVSNHGGRVLADAPATAAVLPEIVQAVGGKTVVIVDGGIRSGGDIFKALAMGADAALICRPFATAWFGGGSEGVGVYIEKLRAELVEAMYMCGARSLAEIRPDMIRFKHPELER